jgi:acyl dehydratase
MQYKYYWEDFQVGETVELGRHTVDREAVIAFAKEFDPQPFHVDEEAAKTSFYGGLIASGWHTCGIVMRMMCDSYLNQSASLGSPGVDSVRWLLPVRPGDTLRATRTILESRASSSKPTMGIVKNRWDVYNQNDDKVMTMEGYGLFARRSSS